MELDLSRLQPSERAAFALRSVYQEAGCCQYRLGRFEEYSLYQANRSFLPAGQLVTFTDLDGRLLALKPDVTLSIAKSARPAPGQILRYYYHEKVCRPSEADRTFREIDQMGLELLGAAGPAQDGEAVELAVRSLDRLGRPWVLEIGHMGYLFGLMDALCLPQTARPRLMEALRAKNAHELRAAAREAGGEEAARALCGLLELCGEPEQLLPVLEQRAVNPAMTQAAAQLRGLARILAAAEGSVRLDMSLAGEMEYYNGLVFRGCLQGLPRPVLKGGRYDRLMEKFTPGAGAIGFAVYLDELDRPADPPACPAPGGMLSVALPKGRLGDQVSRLLQSVGCGCPEGYQDSRRLVVENPAAGVRYFLVKPSDVPIYVERGAADVGIAGKDVLAESGAEVYELLDTGLGRCRMCVAAPAGYRDDPARPVRVATKFTRIAKAYYASIGREIEIIRLNGSIELAPLLGLSDVIVDIVETGTTLRENGLEVVTEFMPISARFIANKASYPFRRPGVDAMLDKLRGVLQTEEAAE